MSEYIKLEDVQKIILKSQCLYSSDMGVMINKFFDKQINSLPTINPEEIIQKEIEIINWKIKSDIDNMYYSSARIILKELLQKFKS